MIEYKAYLIPVVLVMIFFLSVSNVNSEIQSSTNYIIEVNVVDGGGGDGYSINYDLLYSVGQSSIIGELSSNNYFIYAGYWNALSGIGPNYHISGSGYNYPEEGFRGSLTLDILKSDLSSGWLEYYYSKLRIHLECALITEVSAVGNTITIKGECTVNGVAGYTFEATIIDSNPDSMEIIIYNPDGTIYFQSGPSTVSGGDFIIDIPITCVNFPVRLSEAISDYYPFVQNAYNEADYGVIMQIHDTELTESIHLDRNISVTLDGGYDCRYSSTIGLTKINGNLIISNGTVEIGNITLE